MILLQTQGLGMRYILLLFVILISYGSLYPFHFSGNLLSAQEVNNWIFNLSYRTTNADILANILLFVPFGFVSIMLLSTSRKVIFHAGVLLIAGTLFAFILQYLQLYLPARVPSAADAWYNSLGIACGMLLAHVIKKYSQNHLPEENAAPVDWSQITIPLLLALVWVTWRLFPFVPLFTTESIMQAVHPLTSSPELNFTLIIRDSIGWLVFFHLLTRPPFDRLPRFRILKFILYIFSLEILIRDNSISVNDLLAALCAFAIFASLSTVQLQQGLSKGLALAISLTLITPLALAVPYNDYLWQPFASFMKGNPWINGELLLLKIFFYASLVYLLSRSWIGWLGATGLSVGLLLAISLLQIVFGQHNGEFTEPLLVGLIAWIIRQVEKSAFEEKAMILKREAP